MSSLQQAVDDYLTLRHALGFKLQLAARQLPRFACFLERAAATHVTTHMALLWAQQDPSASPVTHADRLSLVRGFAKWRSAEDPRTEIPTHGLLPRRYRRPAPYIYSKEEVGHIVSTAAALPSDWGLRGATYSTLFGLMAVTGMRVGETVGLDRGDVDLEEGILTIRAGKHGKARFIPVHATTRSALERYARLRDEAFPDARAGAFFLSKGARRASAWAAGDNFIKVSRKVGLRPDDVSGKRGRGPRLHDLRHRFAVQTLIDWYRAEADVDREIPKLATYLGHRGPEEVYWYLQAVPELLDLATNRSSWSGGTP